jgi:hypothetical protein
VVDGAGEGADVGVTAAGVEAVGDGAGAAADDEDADEEAEGVVVRDEGDAAAKRAWK